MDELKRLFIRALALMDRWEQRQTSDPAAVDWLHSAFLWHHDGDRQRLQQVAYPHQVKLEDLLCIDRQKSELVRNTRQFVNGHPANNALLWGARGTGKSTLVKAVFNAFADAGLRLIEVDKRHLVDLPEMLTLLRDRPERFLIYCDDLTFQAEDHSYTALKAILEGSIAAPADNVLIYATSNRRHLMPRDMMEDVQSIDGEIHPGEAIEEQVSLSERFGLWLSFYGFSQDQYLVIVDHWLHLLGDRAHDAGVQQAALQWARQRGSRSGRVAKQFAIDWLGREHG